MFIRNLTEIAVRYHRVEGEKFLPREVVLYFDTFEGAKDFYKDFWRINNELPYAFPAEFTFAAKRNFKVRITHSDQELGAFRTLEWLKTQFKLPPTFTLLLPWPSNVSIAYESFYDEATFDQEISLTDAYQTLSKPYHAIVGKFVEKKLQKEITTLTQENNNLKAEIASLRELNKPGEFHSHAFFGKR